MRAKYYISNPLKNDSGACYNRTRTIRPEHVSKELLALPK